MLITVKINQNGVVVVSKPVREALDVTEGDLIEMRVEGYISTVPLRTNGRVSVPAQIRNEEGIEAGDLVQINVGLPGQ